MRASLAVFVAIAIFVAASFAHPSVEVPIGRLTTFDALPRKGAVDPPQQVHIAYAGGNATATPDHMMISWQTLRRTSSNEVVLGTEPGQYTRRFYSNDSHSYFETWDHHVKIGPLRPNTRYYYACGSEQEGFSQEFSFVSAAGPEKTSFKFAVWGDLATGKAGNAEATFNFLRNNWNVTDFMWHVGDISYANNDFLHDLFGFHYEEIWRQFMNDMQPMASTHAYMVLPGNHEAECHSPACFLNKTKLEMLRNYTAYNSRFRMPSAESGGVANMWYSFNYANAHFISFDSETDFKNAPGHDTGDSGLIPAGHFAPEGTQIAWLEKDLSIAAQMRKNGVRPWIFMGGHRPIYKQSGEIVKAQQDAIEDLMNKYGVDIFFTGHEHLYLRTWPVYRGSAEKTYNNPSKVVHLLVGGAGNEEMNVKTKVDFEGRPIIQEGEQPRKYTADYYDGSVIERIDVASRIATRLRNLVSTAPADKRPQYQELHDRYVKKAQKRLKEREENARATRKAALGAPAADWIVTVDDNHYSAGVVEVHNNTHLTFKVYDTATGIVLDQIDLYKQH